jgi:murein L,D-transpeptidase YafK
VRSWIPIVFAAAVALLAGRSLMSPTSPKERVREAMAATEEGLKDTCRRKGISYPPKSIFIRAFKQEREMEVWAEAADGKMRLLRTYPIVAMSGGPGPKRKEGDRQVPEGVYFVDRYNPNSAYHLSLGLNYPNASDKLRGDRQRPGHDIFIHGSNVSIGCLAMTDEKIEEIYTLALGPKDAGKRIAVHIFPCRMEGETYGALRARHPDLVRFWSELEPIYAAFEQVRKVPQVRIASDGSYSLASR